MEVKFNPLRPGILEYFRGFAFGLLFFSLFLVSFFIVLLDLAVSFFGKRFLFRPLIHWISLYFPRLVGIKIEVRGKDNLPKGGCVMLCKHMSLYETCVIGTLPNCTPVIRGGFSKVPIFHAVVSHLGVIWVERGSGYGGLMSLLRTVKEAVNAGRNVALFPEGTRTLYGQDARMKLGIMQLYPEVTFLPVALNCGLVFGKSIFSPKFPGTAVIEILPPISPNLEIEAARSAVASTIQNESDKLCEEFLSSYK